MTTYRYIRDAWEIVDIEGVGDPVPHPERQCELCGAAISEKWSEITGKCSNCTRGINEVGDDLDRIYAVTIYFSEAEDHSLSNQLAPPKDGSFAKEKARILQWGIENLDELHEVDLLVPPPSGGEDEYNHMVDTGERLSRHVGIPFRDVTNGDYQPQKDMDSLSDRKENIQGEVTCAADLHHVDRVLVIDDIVTTGATLSDTARALLEAGAGEVQGLTVSRSMDFRGLEDAKAMEAK